METFLNFIKDYKDTIQTAFTIATFFIALYGLNTWQRQIKGGTIFNSSKELLEQIHRFKNALSYVRSVYMTSSEYPDDLRKKQKLSEEEKLSAEIFAYNTRLKNLQVEYVLLEEKFVKLLVIYGEECDIFLNPLRRCRSELLVRFEDYFEIKHKKHFTEQDQKEIGQLKRVIRGLDLPSEQDLLSPKINEATGIIVRWTRPKYTNRLIDKIRSFGTKKKASNFDISPLTF